MPPTHPTAIYTMRHWNDLRYAHRTGGIATFTERKRWVTGERQFRKAVAEGRAMPILFSAADVDSGLIYYAWLDSVDVDDEGTEYTFHDLTEIRNAKPKSKLTLLSTGKPLSDNYIRPYAIVETPKQLRRWGEEEGLPPTVKSRKTGEEPFHHCGKTTGASLQEYWQWSSSVLMDNAQRGILAEYIVAKALGLEKGIRTEWDAFDLLMPDGTKIEVKSAAYIQSWRQKGLSRISFGIRKTRMWDEEGGMSDEEPRRRADIYVFALLNHKVQATVDPLDVGQWVFYVLATEVLERVCGDAKTVGLGKVRRMGVKCGYGELGGAFTPFSVIFDR